MSTKSVAPWRSPTSPSSRSSCAQTNRSNSSRRLPSSSLNWSSPSPPPKKGKFLPSTQVSAPKSNSKLVDHSTESETDESRESPDRKKTKTSAPPF